LEEWPKVWSNRRGTKATDAAALKAAVYQQIGQLNGALDGLNKNVGPLR
jgi:hypothetical protein